MSNLNLCGVVSAFTRSLDESEKALSMVFSESFRPLKALWSLSKCDARPTLRVCSHLASTLKLLQLNSLSILIKTFSLRAGCIMQKAELEQALWSTSQQSQSPEFFSYWFTVSFASLSCSLHNLLSIQYSTCQGSTMYTCIRCWYGSITECEEDLNSTNSAHIVTLTLSNVWVTASRSNEIYTQES